MRLENAIPIYEHKNDHFDAVSVVLTTPLFNSNLAFFQKLLLRHHLKGVPLLLG